MGKHIFHYSVYGRRSTLVPGSQLIYTPKWKREEILNEKNDEEIIRGREILKKIIYKVEPEFNKYSDLDKEKISELLYWLYEELSSRIGISQEEKFEWNTMGIKLFRLKKYKKYWEPRGIRYRI